MRWRPTINGAIQLQSKETLFRRIAAGIQLVINARTHVYLREIGSRDARFKHAVDRAHV